MRSCLLALLLLMLGCAKAEYRFERIDRDPPEVLPLTVDRFSGLRDGANVTAEAQFSGGGDSLTMDISIFLRPPVEFRSGAYRGTIAGKMVSGSVDCPSLDFQGGQTALPSVGGTFILNAESGAPAYRVTIPSTQLTSSGLPPNGDDR